MRNKTKSELAAVSKYPPAVAGSVAACAPVAPSASVDDTAAFLRAAPLLVDVLRVEVPSKVPTRGATFAQQELRKLDGDLGSETDRALLQLVTLGPDRLAADLGPATSRLRGLDELVQRRADSAAVLARVRTLLDYAETQQRVFDHDAVLVMEAVGEAVAYLGQFDDALRARYSATLAVLSARNAKVAEGRANARASEPQPPR